MDNFDIIRIPMRTSVKIEKTEIFDTIDIGEIFYYDPDIIFHKELMDAGFLIDIPRDECVFRCNLLNLYLSDAKKYKLNEIVNTDCLSDKQLYNLVLCGDLRKELKNNILPNVSIKKKRKKFKYSDIAKALGISFRELREKAKKLDIELKKASDKVTKIKMNEIIEAIK